jgi:tripartite-type tricarboxylate transporter receptor subunit TctC
MAAAIAMMLVAACGNDPTPTPTQGATATPTPTVDPIAQARDHFSGQTIKFYVGYGAGGGQDTNARITAKYFGKHVPGNPNIVVENVPGADNLLAGQTAFRNPADGLSIVLVNNVRSQAQAISGEPETGFNLFEAKYLGNTQITTPGSSAMLCTRNDVATTWDGMFAYAQAEGRPLNAGVFRAGSWGEILPKYFDIPVKPVPGFEGTASILQGIDQKELEVLVDACTFDQLTRAREDWINSGDVITPLVNYGGETLEPAKSMFDTAGWAMPPLLEDVMELTDFQTRLLSVARASANLTTHPFVIRGDTPDYIYKALLKALEDTAKDPEFVAEMAAVNRVGGYTAGSLYEGYLVEMAAAASGDLEQAVRDFAGLVE